MIKLCLKLTRGLIRRKIVPRAITIAAISKPLGVYGKASVTGSKYLKVTQDEGFVKQSNTDQLANRAYGRQAD